MTDRRRMSYVRHYGMWLAARDGGWMCAYCGTPLRPYADRKKARDVRAQPATVDHVTPLSLGGKDTLENMVLACRACNKAKGSMRQLRKVER